MDELPGVTKLSKSPKDPQIKEKAISLSWSTYLEVLEDVNLDVEVRLKAAKDILESIGELGKRMTPQQNTMIVNVDPDHLAKTLKAMKSLQLEGSDDS
jgi:hypothetical protein